MEDWRRHPIVRSVRMGLGAIVLYGGWAAIANADHGLRAAALAGATQGAVSFTSTFFITGLMEGLFRLASDPRRGFALAAVGAIALMSSLTVPAHVLAGTPDLAATVIPVLSLGSVYCLIYSANLWRERVRAAEQEPT